MQLLRSKVENELLYIYLIRGQTYFLKRHVVCFRPLAQTEIKLFCETNRFRIRVGIRYGLNLFVVNLLGKRQNLLLSPGLQIA